MPRLFLGLALPDPVKQELLSWREDVPGARWQNQDQLHVTLCFLGLVDPERVPAIFRALAGLAGSSFEVRPAGVGCFGRAGAPRHLWAAVEPAGHLQALHTDLCRRLQHQGFTIETRQFEPHVTLARFGRRQAGSVEGYLERYRHARGPAFAITGVNLFLSQPGQDGSRYTALARFPLRQAEPPRPLTVQDEDGDHGRL